MKQPRTVSGEQLIQALRTLGYEVVRQRGSHVRLRHAGSPVHSVTVPKHRTIKVGTPHSILTDVARARSLTVEEVEQMLH